MNAPFTLNGEPFDCCDPKHGPVYPRLPGLDKFRRIANSGKETEADARAYGRAVGDAIRSLNGIHPHREISTACTMETDARCRARILREFNAAITAERARRTDAEIIAAYGIAMGEKRLGELADQQRRTLKAQLEASIEFLAAPTPQTDWQALLQAAPILAPANAPQPAKAATRARKSRATPKVWTPFTPRPQAVPPGILATIARRMDPAYKPNRVTY